MARRTACLWLAVTTALCLYGCGGGDGSGGGGSGHKGNPLCESGTYLGDLGGMQATAHLSFEVLPNTTIMAGDIRSAVAWYTFQGDIATDPWSGPVTNVGYVDVTDMGNGERFRA